MQKRIKVHICNVLEILITVSYTSSGIVHVNCQKLDKTFKVNTSLASRVGTYLAWWFKLSV